MKTIRQIPGVNRKPRGRVVRPDRDIAIIRKCARLLDTSTSPRMARANLEFLYGHYMRKLGAGREVL